MCSSFGRICSLLTVYALCLLVGYSTCWLAMLHVWIIWSEMHNLDIILFIAIQCVQLILEGGEEELRPYALLTKVEWVIQVAKWHCQFHQDRWHRQWGKSGWYNWPNKRAAQESSKSVPRKEVWGGGDEARRGGSQDDGVVQRILKESYVKRYDVK